MLGSFLFKMTTEKSTVMTTTTATTTTTTLSPTDQERLDLMNDLLRDNLQEFDIQEDLAAIDPGMIRANLEELTRVPHIAGEERDQELASFIANTWRDQGLDSVDVTAYEFLLSYPIRDSPNMIVIEDGLGTKVFESHNREDIPDLDGNFVDAFLAYAPSGQVKGNIVYVNYGRVEDFELLSDPEGSYFTNVQGNICLARYGEIFRGNKVVNAENYGCIGMIIYSDPNEVAGMGTGPEDVYPNTQFLPGSGIQRGTILPEDGDPTTPNFPSIEHSYRLSDENVDKLLPRIPAQPIGYDDATIILRQLEGLPPPPSWIGDISDPEVDYNLGGGFKSTCSDCKAILSVHNERKMTQNSNVIGVIKGDIEPDKYVLIGNHRDAWGFGAGDPSSGTAQMLEVSRILGGKVKNENWRPRRSIVFLSWAAEEYGLIGSREFAEDFMGKLMERAIAYINIDICAAGPILRSRSSPLIKHKVYEATKNVPDPNNSSQSYYDFWKNWYSDGLQPDVEPPIELPDAGSDHASFIYFLGIPVIDLSFKPDYKAFPEIGSSNYPAYHTGFETFQWMDTLIDPDYKIHSTCSKLITYLGRDLADSLVHDFRPQEYANLMNDTVGDLEKLNQVGVDPQYLIDQIYKFAAISDQWTSSFDSDYVKKNPMLTRIINSQMTRLDRLFLLPQGLPGRALYRHAIISPSKYDSYGSSVFPGISDLLHDIDSLSPDEFSARIEQLKRHVSDLMIVIKAAGNYLKDVSLIA